MSLPEGWTVEKVCKICGKTFEAHAPTAKYCSDGCRKAAKRERERGYRESHHEELRERQREYMRMRYHTDPEFREKALERNRQWAKSEKGKAYKQNHARQYHLERKEERKRRTCGFKGRCSDCPFDYCPE